MCDDGQKIHWLKWSCDDVCWSIFYWWDPSIATPIEEMHDLPMGSKNYNTNGKSVWFTRETMLKIKPHLVIFNKNILVGQWTFQLTPINLKQKIIFLRGVNLDLDLFLFRHSSLNAGFYETRGKVCLPRK